MTTHKCYSYNGVEAGRPQVLPESCTAQHPTGVSLLRKAQGRNVTLQLPELCCPHCATAAA